MALQAGLRQYKHHAVHNDKHLVVLAIRSKYPRFKLHFINFDLRLQIRPKFELNWSENSI